MQSRLDEPPPSYIKTTMKQLESADRKLFLLISEKTREGIKCNAKGRPVDDVFKECMESSEVMSLLQPRPGGISAGPRPAEAHPEGERPNKRFKGAGKSRGKGFGKPRECRFVRAHSKRTACVGISGCNTKGTQTMFFIQLENMQQHRGQTKVSKGSPCLCSQRLPRTTPSS